MANNNGAILAWQRKNPRTGAVTEDGLIVIDIVMEESVTKDAKATQYPVEVGSKPTDHHRPENTKVSLNCYLLSYGTSLANGGVQNDSDIEAQDGTRDVVLFDKLDSLRKDSVLLTYVTPKRSIENCLITSMKYTHTNATGKDALKLSLELEEQTFVELKRVQTKKIPQNAKNNICAPETKAGEKAGTVPKDKEVINKSGAKHFAAATKKFLNLD